MYELTEAELDRIYIDAKASKNKELFDMITMIYQRNIKETTKDMPRDVGVYNNTLSCWVD